MRSNNSGNGADLNKSRIARRVYIRYLLTLTGFIAAFLLFVYLAWLFCRQFTWYYDDPLYIILGFIKEHILFFILIPLLGGWAFITFRFMRLPLRYLDSVISASEKIVELSDEQIILPDELKTVQDNLNDIRETARRNASLAKENEKRKNDLIMYLAHDLKTPLSSVIGYLTLLRDEEQISPELRAKYLSITLDKAERLEDLINEFFEITRFNLSNITLQYSRIDLTRLLEQLIFEFKPMLKEKNLSCELKAPDNLMTRCDADKISRVFDNLLRNAVIYSFPDTELNIKAEKSETDITVRFRNHGNTIPKEKLSKIFEQFYRLDAARSSGGGSGLGLAIAKQIIELHNGTICAESANDTVEFTVTIPLS